MLTCFLQIALGLDRESATEIVLCFLETSACGIFSLHCAVLSTNFGSTGRLHYFSAIHQVRAHASYMGVVRHAKKTFRILIRSETEIINIWINWTDNRAEPCFYIKHRITGICKLNNKKSTN